MIFYYRWSKIVPVLFYVSFILLLAVIILPVVSPNHDHRETAEDFYFENIAVPPGDHDPILAAYNDPDTVEMVISFFEEITGARDLAAIILVNSAEFNVPPSIVFSLGWEESRFNPKAVNRANTDKSIDRGLFQLNSSSFPGLREEDFFDPETNAFYGIAHLKHCLDIAGTEVAALAMYNAGTGRVRAGGTPKVTLDYVSRILKKQRQIEENFNAQYSKIEKIEPSGEPEQGFALCLLAPLGK